jgi:mitochondrial chaperone BCS1
MFTSPGLIDTITSKLLSGNNQFASGGLLLMVIGGIAAIAKDIPYRIYDWFRRQFTLTLIINDEKESFRWFKWWFQNQEYSKRFRNMDAFTPWQEDEYKIMFSPAPGRHWFFYKGRPLFIHIERTEDKKPGSDSGSFFRRSETLTIWTFGRKQQFMKDLLQEVHDDYHDFWQDKPILELWSGDDWYIAQGYAPRSLDSVIMPQEQKEQLLADIQRFKDSEEWYQKMGIPFHRGYLFYGPPGTGKTSMVTGLSSYFNCRVYVLKLNDMTDSNLMQAISNVRPDSMVVLEDVDCAIHKRAVGEIGPDGKKKKKEKEKKIESGGSFGMGVTLSGLLNALDGMQSPVGVIYFMTTNQIEKLDHALLRPGRTDVKMFFGPADEQMKLKLYMRFFPEDDEITATQFVQAFPSASSMAEFQERCMLERNMRISTKTASGSGVTAAAGD